ncbi:MAG TPA: LuxR C-terminal-related transcriptional regulator [Candidatus Dormibacteraeota bacterium]|nr:LuxR C-terminal-related transcriptional regulator [Candidatus Dormibacteraeota bacterium]
MTLTGAGGVGKTRLALRAAADMARAFPDGVWLIPLAPIEDPRLVTQAVFHALGLQDKGAGWSVSALTDFLTEKHLLMVFDNCEHLLDSCAVLTSTLLQACPQIRVLATSRQALGIAGEVRLRVPSLSLPESGGPVGLDSVLDFEAVALLAERALAVLPSFRIDAKNVAAVVRVCERLDGIPLALELAAVRLEALSLEQLNQALDRELSVLGEGNRGALPRQQTLEATIAWSYLLLSEQERLLWARLAVFTGGFDEEAAVEVCSGSGLSSDEIATLLAKLVEKSILKRDPAAEPTRYMLLETLRQYGRQKLRELGAEVELQRRHRDWVLGLAAMAATLDHKQAAMFDRIYLERDNLWAALDFCVRQPGEAQLGIEICRHLHRYLASRGPMRDARRVLASLIDLSPPDSLARGRGLWVSAVLAVTLPDYVDAKSKAEEGLRIGRLLGDVEVMACSLRCLGIVARAQGRVAEADPLAESALALARAMQSAPITLAVMNSLCGVRLSAGDLDGVVALGEEALAMSMESGELWMRGYLLNHVSKARWLLGETQLAESLAQEGIFCKHALDDRFGLAILIDTLAWMVVQRGAAQRAATLLGYAQYLRESVAALPLANFDIQREWSEVSAREAIGESAFAAAVAAGRAMTIDEGVAYALDQKKQTKPAPLASKRPTPLTRRQLEIAWLVAQGLSNKQIAARLVVSERTADSHILNILNKLGFNSRAQIANWVATKEPMTSIRT